MFLGSYAQFIVESVMPDLKFKIVFTDVLQSGTGRKNSYLVLINP